MPYRNETSPAIVLAEVCTKTKGQQTSGHTEDLRGHTEGGLPGDTWIHLRRFQGRIEETMVVPSNYKTSKG